jgi:crotonobetaine/carnitine-CoA ligase
MTAATIETFAHQWIHSVDTHGASTFLIFEDESGIATSWTYQEFDDVVQQTLSSLIERGLQPGDTVHVALRNSPAFIALWLAAARRGARFVPVDPAASYRDITNQIDRITPAIGFYAAARADTYTRGIRESNHRPLVVALDETPADVSRAGPLDGTWRTTDLPHPVPSTPMAVMFTSGTTSQPKGVVLTQANYAHVARVMSSSINLQPHHRWLVTLPLFHANAQYYCFAPAIAVGASVALTATFSASRWVQSAHDLHATHASLFAAPMRMILARTPSDAPQLTLEHVWFAQSLGSAHHAAFGDLAGTAPRQLYGMTETVAIVTCDRSNPPVHNVIGLPVADRRVRITDPIGADKRVEPGEPGLLEV